MAHAESITFVEFRIRFSTEDACRAELFRLRFPNGFICPKCGCTEYYPVRGRNVFQCHACRHQTSVTAGTVMHRTHLPLTIWFWAIYLCATDKRGVSVVSRFMRKFDYGSGRNLLQGGFGAPLVTFGRSGRKGSRAAVRRLSCP